jgi:radical SAM superfamily enzyme YgiQ (UPF0313 family)
LLDYGIDELDRDALLNKIRDEGFGLVGISIVTPKVYDAMELAEFVKSNFPDIVIVAGGPHATLVPEEVLTGCPSIDYVIQGEGELLLNELIKRLEEGNPPDDLDGITYRKYGNIINNPHKEYIADLNILPMPDRSVIDLNRYSSFLKTSLAPATTVMTSRGCPYRCIYCSKPVTGEKVRAITPENAIKEIEFLIKEHGVKEIIFYDDSFTIKKKRAIEICDLIIQKGIKIKWQCETRVNLVDEELLRKMKEAGCYLIAYGLESGSDNVLKILKKGVTTAQIEEAVRITKKVGIQITGYFMLGIPGETEDDIKKTIKLAKNLNVDYAQFAVATAFPGTELYQIAKDKDKITKDWSKSIYALGGKPIISLSDVPIDRLDYFVRKAYRSFYFRPSYVFNKIRKIKSLKDLLFNLRGFKTLLKNS